MVSCLMDRQDEHQLGETGGSLTDSRCQAEILLEDHRPAYNALAKIVKKHDNSVVASAQEKAIVVKFMQREVRGVLVSFLERQKEQEM